MILNDSEITELAAAGMIVPFAERAHRPGVISYGVTSFGYDIRVADEWIEYTQLVVNPKMHNDHRTFHANYYNLLPGAMVLCRSVETFALPDDVIGIAVGKSTYARCGLIVNITPLEPGWCGTLTVELHNVSQHVITIAANEGIAQIMFHRGNRPAVTYADRAGKYMHQTGVTLPRVEQ